MLLKSCKIAQYKTKIYSLQWSLGKMSDVVHYVCDENPAWKERDSFHIAHPPTPPPPPPPKYYCGSILGV
jgi:hypothetical protein